MPKITIEEIFENIFSQEDIRIIDNLTQLDINTLKKLGSVDFSSTEENGIITDTLIFTEPSGIHDFKRVSSYNKNDKDYDTVQIINEQIAMAVSEENYELAAVLKHKKEDLLFNSQLN